MSFYLYGKTSLKTLFLIGMSTLKFQKRLLKNFILIGQSTNSEQNKFSKKELEKIKRIEKTFPLIKETSEGLEKTKKTVNGAFEQKISCMSIFQKLTIKVLTLMKRIKSLMSNFLMKVKNE